jgi:hypothetical protein
MAEYVGCIIEPRGRVYIDVQGPSLSIRQDTRSISILNLACTARYSNSVDAPLELIGVVLVHVAAVQGLDRAPSCAPSGRGPES